MKITDAWIDDPTLVGELDVPQLCVEVDESPDSTIPMQDFSGGWRVGKFGPFVRYDCNSTPVDAGDFNVRFRGRFPVIVDINLYIGKGDENGSIGYSLPLSRARQLVRKYDETWRLLVNDKAAEKGTILWRPVQTGASCRYWLGTKCCGERPARTVRVGEVELPLCDAHVKAHNDKYAARRTARA